jgi:hypothetical protein
MATASRSVSISRSVHCHDLSRRTLVELLAQRGEQASQKRSDRPRDRHRVRRIPRGTEAVERASGAMRRLASLGAVSEQSPGESTESTEETAAPAPASRPAPGVADEPVLPDRGSDDTDHGWGEPPDDDPDERLRREVPPHW